MNIKALVAIITALLGLGIASPIENKSPKQCPRGRTLCGFVLCCVSYKTIGGTCSRQLVKLTAGRSLIKHLVFTQCQGSALEEHSTVPRLIHKATRSEGVAPAAQLFRCAFYRWRSSIKAKMTRG